VIFSTAVAKDFDINGHMLGRWCKQLEEQSKKAFPARVMQAMKR